MIGVPYTLQAVNIRLTHERAKLNINSTWWLHVFCYLVVPKVMLGSLMVEEPNDPYLENVPIKANVLSVESLQWSQPFNPNM